MTEQEAEVLAARFARVWCCRDCGVQAPTQGELAFNEEGYWEWWASLESGVEVEIRIYGSGELRIDLQHHPLGVYRRCGQLTCEEDVVDPGVVSGKLHCAEEEFALFATQWLPFFRRGCWLSGCDIEASAHEKAEWMEGFSREELEAWNLKM